jgi:phosphoesterase RecJ-like protein
MDTATFQHGNTTPRTLQVAALLLAAGAPISEISRRLYRSRSFSQLQLHARVLGRVESSDAGRTVWAALSLEDLSATGSTAEESEGIVDALAQVVEADVALFLKEDGPTATRLSIRTKELGPDATRIAAAFGGGGHARAAGATIGLPLAEASGAALKAVAELRAGANAS